jgi:hypothetical protein
MADAKDFVPTIQPFMGENFPAWKFQMAMIFGSRDLLGIVNGTEKKPAGTATDDAVIAWTKRDMIASTMLVQTIDQEIIKALVGYTTSAEIWSHLSTL